MSLSRSRGTLLLVAAIAVVLRLAVAVMLGDKAEPVSGAFDQVTYDMLAQRLLAGRGFSFPTNWYPFTAANEPTAHWSFVYPLYLAGVYALFGHHPLAARLIQVLLSALSLLLTFRIGQRLFGDRVGLTAAALAALYAYFIFFNAALMTQTFYIVALLWVLYLALGIGEGEGDNSRWVLLGIALGLGTLLRQTMLLFSPLLFGYLWWMQRRPGIRSQQHPNGRKRSTHGMLLAVAVIALLVLPWTVRNYAVFHDFLLLNSNGGYWFYSSNYPGQGTSFDGNYGAPVPAVAAGLAEPALDRLLFREAVTFVAADPLRFVLLSINRLKDYFWVVPTDQSSTISNVARLLSFTLYFPFMMYGLYLSLKQWVLCVPLYLYAAFDTGLSLISWSAPRYRLPTDAVMMVFAALAVVTLAERAEISKKLEARLGAGKPTPNASNP